jgi:predicted TIM-barrel fold metal-dependent hydrolase
LVVGVDWGGTMAEKMSTLRPEVLRKILGENAAKFYRL